MLLILGFTLAIFVERLEQLDVVGHRQVVRTRDDLRKVGEALFLREDEGRVSAPRTHEV